VAVSLHKKTHPADVLERLKRPALIMVLLILASLIAFNLVVIPVTFEPPYLTLFLNILFNGIPAFVIAFLSIRGFLRSGAWPALWFSLGTVFYGLSSVLVGLIVIITNINEGYTFYEISLLMASVIYLVGAFFIVNDIPPLGTKFGRLIVISQVYLAAIIIIVLIIILSTSGILPPFFMQGQNGPLAQQLIAGIAAALFIVSSITIFWQYRKTRSNFFYWYSLGLLLIFMSLVGLLVLHPTITLFSWIGRISGLLSGLYFLAAAMVTFQEARFNKIAPEQALINFFQRQEEKLKLLFESLAEAVVITDRNFNISGWNRAAEKIFGWRAEEVIGKPVREVSQTKWIYDIDERKAEEYLMTNGNWKGEVLQKHKDGHDIPVLTAVSLLKDESGNPAGTVGINTDITEIKKVEDALNQAKSELEIKVKERTSELAESEEKYRLLVENANETVVVFQDKMIKFVNPKAMEVFGYSREELTSRTIDEFIHPDDKELVIGRYLQQIGGTEVLGSYEFKVIHKDGSIKWVSINAVSIIWEGKLAVLGLLTDVTESKKASEALLRTGKELTEANEQLKQYARRITDVQEEERKRIAYELHDDTAQYLAILKLELDSLLQSKKIQDPQVAEKLQFLEKDASRAIDDVRRYSHELRPAVLDRLGLLAALEQVAEDINKLKQITVELTVEGEEQPLSEDIRLGLFRIAQEATNNARKHSKASLATIRLDFLDNSVRLTVQDNGVGFDTQKAPNFSTLKGSLGLTSMQERAKLIGANLIIDSQPGQGTRITVEKTYNAA
jgi:PAS domain S-box-containing protein